MTQKTRNIIEVVVVIFNLSTLFVIAALWQLVGGWALLYFFVWLGTFIYLSNKYGLFEYTDQQKRDNANFEKGKTYMGSDAYYGTEFWQDNATGEIFEV